MKSLKHAIFLSALFLFFFQSIHSQWKYNDIPPIKNDVVISYDVIYENELSEKQKKSSSFIKEIVVAFNKDKMTERRYTNSSTSENYVILDYDKETAYNCSVSRSSKNALSSKFKLPKKEATLQANVNRTHLGLPCEQYITIIKGKPYKIYSTKKFGLRYVKNYNVHGLLLDYTLNDKYLGNYRVVAKKIDYFKLPKSTYSLEGFHIQDLKEYLANRKKSSNKYDEIYKKMVGSKAPKFRYRTTTGEKFNYKNTLGKVLVINFWFTTCPPCKSEIPHLNNLKQEFIEEPNVEFLGVALDDQSRLSKFIRVNKFDYKLITDGRYDAKLFKVPAYPTTVIIDKKGIIRYYKVGGVSSSRVRELSYKIQDLLEADTES